MSSKIIKSNLEKLDNKSLRDLQETLTYLTNRYKLRNDRKYIIIHKDNFSFLNRSIKEGKVRHKELDYNTYSVIPLIPYIDDNILILDVPAEAVSVLESKVKWKSDLLQVHSLTCMWLVAHVPEGQTYNSGEYLMEQLKELGIDGYYNCRIYPTQV